MPCFEDVELTVAFRHLEGSSIPGHLHQLLSDVTAAEEADGGTTGRCRTREIRNKLERQKFK